MKEYDDAPRRIYINLDRAGFITIAMGINQKTQSWNIRKGSTRNWRWITYRPHHSLVCEEKGCGKLKWHKKGNHSEPAWSKEEFAQWKETGKLDHNSGILAKLKK